MRSRMHLAIQIAAGDSNSNVRLTAVEGLGRVADPADLPLLQRIADGDAERGVSRGEVTFPVRVAAQRAMTRIRASR